MDDMAPRYVPTPQATRNSGPVLLGNGRADAELQEAKLQHKELTDVAKVVLHSLDNCNMAPKVDPNVEKNASLANSEAAMIRKVDELFMWV